MDSATETSPYARSQKSGWPFRLPGKDGDPQIEELRAELARLCATAQYGWGQTMDFGPFTEHGHLGDGFLYVAGALDKFEFWPRSMEGMTVADVGCFSGGLSLLMAARGAAKVIAVDEVPAHLAQCAFVARTFGVESVACHAASLYNMPERFAPESFDLMLVSGVLYHLSDMLVGLIALQSLLKPGGVLLLESTALECFDHSYANFGRFVGGMWWQPTALCIQEMCEFTGFSRPDIRFYVSGRCVARATKPAGAEVRFKRGMNWKFPNLLDGVPRTVDTRILPPQPCNHER